MKKAAARVAQRLTKYELVAFVAGFSLLAYELSAARILAPSIGSSTYVWTSVIGVIIAALSLGYAAGGILADRRVRSSDISWLLLLGACGVVFTLTTSDTVLALIAGTVRDPRLQGLTVATLLFSPTSFALGVISPYLARLRNVTVETTGTSVAFLSAANAIGSITGTFSVGFIFFGYVGSRETLIFTALLLTLTSLFFAASPKMFKIIGSGLFVALLIFAISPPEMHHNLIADIDTSVARYKVFDTIYHGKPVRLLSSGPRAIQSGVFQGGSKEPVFWYTQEIAALTDQLANKNRILILGGGAFTLPEYFATKYPTSKIDVVEIDPQLASISRRYFNYSDHPNITIIPLDARAYLNSNTEIYDLIVVDVYSDNAIPFSVTTREFTARLKSSLRPDGVVLANVIGSDNDACRPLLRSIHGSFAHAFTNYKVYPYSDPQLQVEQNLIFEYSEGSIPEGPAISHDLSGGMVLTDDYAPVERLQQACQTGSS